MQLIKRIRIIGTFYRSFAPGSLLITVCSLVLFRRFGLGIIVGLFWLKVATLAVLFYFTNLYKQKEYYYYGNLGISKKQLWMAVIGFDFLLFIFLLTQIHSV